MFKNKHNLWVTKHKINNFLSYFFWIVWKRFVNILCLDWNLLLDTKFDTMWFKSLKGSDEYATWNMNVCWILMSVTVTSRSHASWFDEAHRFTVSLADELVTFPLPQFYFDADQIIVGSNLLISRSHHDTVTNIIYAFSLDISTTVALFLAFRVYTYRGRVSKSGYTVTFSMATFSFDKAPASTLGYTSKRFAF
jgi:hypothetical protein